MSFEKEDVKLMKIYAKPQVWVVHHCLYKGKGHQAEGDLTLKTQKSFKSNQRLFQSILQQMLSGSEPAQPSPAELPPHVSVRLLAVLKPPCGHFRPEKVDKLVFVPLQQPANNNQQQPTTTNNLRM